MGKGPQQKASATCQLQATKIGDGCSPVQDSHAAEIRVTEPRTRPSGHDGGQILADEASGLFGRCGHPRERCPILRVAVAAQVAGHADFRVPGKRKVVVHDDPPTAVQLAACGVGQLLPEMGGTHPSGPDHGGGLKSPVAVRGADHHFAGLHGLHTAVRQEFDAVAGQ